MLELNKFCTVFRTVKRMLKKWCAAGSSQCPSVELLSLAGQALHHSLTRKKERELKNEEEDGDDDDE